MVIFFPGPLMRLAARRKPRNCRSSTPRAQRPRRFHGTPSFTGYRARRPCAEAVVVRGSYIGPHSRRPPPDVCFPRQGRTTMPRSTALRASRLGARMVCSICPSLLRPSIRAPGARLARRTQFSSSTGNDTFFRTTKRHADTANLQPVTCYFPQQPASSPPGTSPSPPARGSGPSGESACRGRR